MSQGLIIFPGISDGQNDFKHICNGIESILLKGFSWLQVYSTHLYSYVFVLGTLWETGRTIQTFLDHSK